MSSYLHNVNLFAKCQLIGRSTTSAHTASHHFRKGASMPAVKERERESKRESERERERVRARMGKLYGSGKLHT